MLFVILVFLTVSSFLIGGAYWILSNYNIFELWNTIIIGPAGVLGGLLTVFGNKLKSISAGLRKWEEAEEALHRCIVEEKEKINQEEQSILKRIYKLKDEEDIVRREKDNAEKAVEKAKEELNEVSAGRQLYRFIIDRSEDSKYKDQLGIIAMIRKDFEKLTELITKKEKEQKESEQNEAEVKDLKQIDRIVLYIDDLDRCPSKRVVEVLQAIHLILGLELFVVVVGVDSRWVSCALQKQYEGLLEKNNELDEDRSRGDVDSVSARDYLGKIFQIPYRLKPLEEDDRSKMINGLLRKSMLTDEKMDIKKTDEPPREKVKKEIDRGNVKKVEEPEEEDKLDEDLRPEKFKISEPELKFMEVVTPIMGCSPRSVKRFVNLYCLVKAGENIKRELFLEEKYPVGDFQIVLFLLSLVTGMPKYSRVFFKYLEDETGGNEGKLKRLDDLMNSLQSKDNEAKNNDYRRLENWYDEHKSEWKQIELDEIRKWADRISRYTFSIVD